MSGEKSRVVNYIEIDGKDVLFESLDLEQRRKLSEQLQEHMMASVGYKRKTA